MVKSRLVRATAVAATSLGFLAAVTGIAGASSGMSTLDHTGPQSTNNVKQISKQHASVTNTNHVSLYSNNSQGSSSGDALATDNTTAGGASSGNATNSSSVSANLTVSNAMHDVALGAGGDGSATSTVSNTGPQSSNNVVQVNKASLKIENDNSICLTTTNSQEASSGDATVSDNTTGGSASTGNASNTSSSSFTLNVTN